MYTNDRNAYRQFFFTTWQKQQNKLPLDAAEARLIMIIERHPEYHALLTDNTMQQEFAPEENPFLHMSLHYAICEQIDMDRPAGIKTIYHALSKQYDNVHDIEHSMMEKLCTMMAKAQKTGTVASDEAYLEELRVLVRLQTFL